MYHLVGVIYSEQSSLLNWICYYLWEGFVI